MNMTKGKAINSLSKRPQWQALQRHFEAIKATHLRALFADDPQRGERLVAEAAGLYLDYSKHRVTDETLRLLRELADACGLRERIEAMFTATGSTPPKIVPCCTLRCALRQANASLSMGRTWFQTCMQCSIAWLHSASACAKANG